MVQLFYTSLISVDLAQYELFHAIFLRFLARVVKMSLRDT